MRMQLTLAGEDCPAARATCLARTRCWIRSTKPKPANAPRPSFRKSLRGIPSQLVLGPTAPICCLRPKLYRTTACPKVRHSRLGVLPSCSIAVGWRCKVAGRIPPMKHVNNAGIFIEELESRALLSLAELDPSFSDDGAATYKFEGEQLIYY